MPRHSSPTHYYVLHAVIKLQYKFEQLILIFRTCTNQEKFWQTFFELYEQSILKNFQTNAELHNAIYIIQYFFLKFSAPRQVRTSNGSILHVVAPSPSVLCSHLDMQIRGVDKLVSRCHGYLH